jgi:dolichol kinase
MNFVLAIAVTFLLLASTELLWRKGHVQKEYARKVVHMSVGTFIAFWPFFLDWTEIRLLSVAFVLVVALSLWFNVFKSIHSVERPTWGEVLFALSVGFISLLTANPYVYAAAILHMSLADGAAAVIGSKFGRTNRYRIFGQYKSQMGSAAFLIVSLAILLAYGLLSATHLSWPLVAVLAVAATALENAGWRGFDNLLVPVVIAVVLETLH